MTVAIVGAGIAGLTLALTLHELRIPFRVYESTAEIGPLGVGINLQPNAVRELFALGLQDKLPQIGVMTKDYGFYTMSGREIWTEPRGRHAGYNWPQYSIHRGELQMLLLRELLERAGPDAVQTGHRLVSYEAGAEKSVAVFATREKEVEVTANLLIGADGIRSAVRAHAHPEEGDPIWNGVVLWRATTQAPAFKSGASMILAGHDSLRFVAYPISEPDTDGIAAINWIAEKRFDPAQGWSKSDWNRAVDRSTFDHLFSDWDFDWLDVPSLIAGAEQVLEYPMVDREPLQKWTQGTVTLIGDAAHPTYPVGSNGASQAILDARILASKLHEMGTNSAALIAFEDQVRPIATAIQIANRGAGPDAIMQRVHDLSGGIFDDINDVISHADLKDHADGYKKLAGLTVEQVNGAAPILSP